MAVRSKIVKKSKHDPIDVAFAKLGPDYDEAINLLAEQVVPALR